MKHKKLIILISIFLGITVSLFDFLLPVIDGKNERRFKASVEHFLESEQSLVKFTKLSPFEENSYDKVCLFLDGDTNPNGAETYAKQEFNEIDIPHKDYKAIITFSLNGDLKALFFRSDVILNREKKYFLSIENSVHKQCWASDRLSVQKDISRLSNKILFIDVYEKED